MALRELLEPVGVAPRMAVDKMGQLPQRLSTRTAVLQRAELHLRWPRSEPRNAIPRASGVHIFEPRTLHPRESGPTTRGHRFCRYCMCSR
jgi:hypothetical protein